MITILNPLTDKRYEDFVSSHPDATVFHSPDWIRVLHESYGFIPHCAASEEKGVITGVLPYMKTRSITGKKRYVSLPFSDFCEPLFQTNGEFDCALEKVCEQADIDKINDLELRGGRIFLADRQPAFKTILTHDIDLKPDEQVILKAFRSSTRRNIKKAERSGVSIVHETSLDALETFYRLNCKTRREHGIPPQPWHFFRYLTTHFLEKNTGFITLAVWKNKAIAANIFLVYGKTAYFKYGAMDKTCQQLRAGNLTMWAGIRQCKAIGCTRLNLGRTERQHTGLLQYKRGFGGIEQTISYFRRRRRNKKFVNSVDGHRPPIYAYVMSRMPIFFLKCIGRLLYKYAA